MRKRNHLLGALLTLTLGLTLACTPETVRISPTPTVAATTVAPTTAAPTPTRTATAAPTTAAPTATVAPPTNSPGSTPSPACAPLTGGSPLGPTRLVAIRAAHNPGFDRLVFEFSGPAVPEYRIELASTFAGPSGLPVRVDGNAFFSIRFSADGHTDAGQKSFPQPDPYRVGLVVVREVKVVEDFEGVLRFGVGMERVVCPTVLTLLAPSRVVVDFPTPP